MNNKQDDDPEETREWIEALYSVIGTQGLARAYYILTELYDEANKQGVTTRGIPYSSYKNTIALEQQPTYPGDLELEERIISIIRWNALAMVVRANKDFGELGGHIASYASAAEIFETGFNHFFMARTENFVGDLVYFQPHSAPGIYARAYLEGRLSEENIANYRQEVSGKGLSSYPHPWLMKDFWQVPTGSMGIGPIHAIYQARFMRYLQARNLANTAGRYVWGIFGDGEMDEPEAIAGLSLAAREGLDNLTFIINCNLQRLDGPVRGNSQIIQELEALFVGAGWNVIKVLWGSEWDNLFARDKKNILLKRFAETVDGQYQTLGSKDGDYNRKKFFDIDPESAALVQAMTNTEINQLKRGGHDLKKLYAAFAAAKAHQGQPTVILAKTKKGFGMGQAGESKMIAHQSKKLNIEALLEFRDRFNLPLSNKEVGELKFYKPDESSREMTYLRSQRQKLGGFLPKRYLTAKPPIPPIPELAAYAQFALAAKNANMSTTTSIVRILTGLLNDKQLGKHVVPIVADEARTFGMTSLFRKIGIYSPYGQLYEPEDKQSLLYYKESDSGQLLEEGITEAGAISSWTAAATAYSLHNVEVLPFYIFYSIFGFQRIGDLIWAAADQRSRGFLIGATSGRTTLSGEGLQHQDGSSHLQAAAIPNCRSYNPTYAYELAIIFDHALKQMLDEKRDEFYYITVMNESYPQPSLPTTRTEIEKAIVSGLYELKSIGNKNSCFVRLVGSGSILLEVIEAAKLLNKQFGITSQIFSATSFTELARQAALYERNKRLNTGSNLNKPQVNKLLDGAAPIIIATDYIRAYAAQIAPYLSAPMTILGTDGFGRSDNRKTLRAFFEVDKNHIAIAAIKSLVQQKKLKKSELERAINLLNINQTTTAPWLC